MAAIRIYVVLCCLASINARYFFLPLLPPLLSIFFLFSVLYSPYASCPSFYPFINIIILLSNNFDLLGKKECVKKTCAPVGGECGHNESLNVGMSSPLFFPHSIGSFLIRKEREGWERGGGERSEREG